MGEGLGETEDGDDGGLAGLTAAVEEEARVRGFEDLDLPEVGLEVEEAHYLEGGGEHC